MNPDQPPAPTPNVSETPRTDATRTLWRKEIRTRDEIWDFARQLERELTAVTRERDELKEDNDYRRTEMGNVWEMVQKISPWQESNDMNWSDEISCGLNGIAEQLTAALARAEKAEEALKRAKNYILDEGNYKTMAPEIEAIDAALTTNKEPAP